MKSDLKLCQGCRRVHVEEICPRCGSDDYLVLVDGPDPGRMAFVWKAKAGSRKDAKDAKGRGDDGRC